MRQREGVRELEREKEIITNNAKKIRMAILSMEKQDATNIECTKVQDDASTKSHLGEEVTEVKVYVTRHLIQLVWK